MFNISYKGLEGILYNYRLIKAGIEINKCKISNIELEDPEDGVAAIGYSEKISKTNKFNSAVEDATIRNIETKEKMKKDLEKAIARDTNTIQMVDLLLENLNEAEREVIELFYIKDMTWVQVSMKTNYSTSWCQELRCKAMDKMLSMANM